MSKNDPDDRTAHSTDDTERPSWKPRPGNYYVMEGTWLKDRLSDKLGVVSGFPDVHEGGTVKILWYSGSHEYLSSRSFRAKLRRGRYEVDATQHPYDKVEWRSGRSLSPGDDR